MRSISETIARLSPQVGGSTADRLADLTRPFDNPGALRARCYVPDDLAAGAPLVVVLHGCTQTAAGYDHGSGWSTLADRHGFALLFPEQVGANNPNRCFNWFVPADTTRGQGEVASIRAMMAAMVALHRLDEGRVFVTGLSAGGAMTAAMLACYPEAFAGGAIVAGLPYGVATSVPQALERMRGTGMTDAAALGRLVRAASPHRGPWPSVSVWHGTADATVAPAAGEAVVAQWLGVHDLANAAPEQDRLDGHPRRRWRDADGRVAMEAHEIAGMGHGTPLDVGDCGAALPFMLDVGVSSSLRIAQSWGIAPPTASRPARTAGKPVPMASGMPMPAMAGSPLGANGVGGVIEDALRAAGLMR